MNSQQEVGSCVGCMEKTTDTIECNCTQGIFACDSCCESRASLRCKDCRGREHRTVYPCLDFQDDPDLVRDTGGRLPVAAAIGAWRPPCRAA